MTINHDELDPGIRETVRRLRDWGFNTTDSGDGITKLANGWPADEVYDQPHVVIKVAPFNLIYEANSLRWRLNDAGICIEPVGRSDIWIQATYDPSDESAVITLFGVGDKAWG